MGIPEVPEQIRRAPLLVLRAVFAGIGRILVSGELPDASAGPRPGGEAGRQRAAKKSGPMAATDPASRFRSLDQTGNVRILTPDGELDRARSRPAATALPLANYDSLTLASIRARLRGLDVGQLRILLDYEVTHAERPELLGMFERRIEKLESGQ
jgi:hypothetical protein